MAEPSVLNATKSRHGYLVSPISDNISETPEGFLVVVGCPIARTGWQGYAARDLPQERARDLGIDLSNPAAEVELYRPAEEVFAAEFLASLNGKPITDGHPPDFVDPDNYSQYAMGHIQNVRRGPEPLEDGEWPIIADLVISSEPLVTKVRNKVARQVSLGYDYSIDREGKRVNQTSMSGNHLAVVPKGRAGDLIAIGDEALNTSSPTLSTGAAPEAPEAKPIAAQPEPAASPPAPSAGGSAQTSTVLITQKEKHKVKNPLMHLFGLGLRAKAADVDTDPEALAQAALDFGKSQGRTARARDEGNGDPEDEVTEVTETQDKKKGKDAVEIGELAKARDRRAKMHDKLDELLEGKDKSKGKDADIAELRDLLDEYLGEEEQEPEHQDIVEDADPSELEEVLGKGEEPDEAKDAEEEVGPSGEANLNDEEEDPLEEEGAEDEEEEEPEVAKATDRARARDAASATLRMLRPFVARVNDDKLNAAFNTALRSVTKTTKARDSRTAGRGYGAFASAARSRSKDADTARMKNFVRGRAADSVNDDPNAKLQAAYDAIRLGKNPGGK